MGGRASKTTPYRRPEETSSPCLLETNRGTPRFKVNLQLFSHEVASSEDRQQLGIEELNIHALAHANATVGNRLCNAIVVTA
ncbi:hypothetical protein EVAR_96246_1 [Eumeta japonica]|uniref:Uncharacterized protein n=1 Tax=Eumeta variegata TaxID=151549 RepID=A0A4C1WLD5_EUMVA|nr:hypothetical protein EVAR_96246_1 [Eumeta japonica]